MSYVTLEADGGFIEIWFSTLGQSASNVQLKTDDDGDSLLTFDYDKGNGDLYGVVAPSWEVDKDDFEMLCQCLNVGNYS